jgi:hypothetical protein
MSVLQKILNDLESEIILPAQFFDAMRPGAPNTGERRLAFAVLGDGLNCYLKYANVRTKAGQKLFHEAEDWIFSTTDRRLFSFENLCETFGIEVQLLRGALTKMDAAELMTVVPTHVVSRRHKAPEMLRRSRARRRERTSLRGPSRVAAAAVEMEERGPSRATLPIAEIDERLSVNY